MAYNDPQIFTAETLGTSQTIIGAVAGICHIANETNSRIFLYFGPENAVNDTADPTNNRWTIPLNPSTNFVLTDAMWNGAVQAIRGPLCKSGFVQVSIP